MKTDSLYLDRKSQDEEGYKDAFCSKGERTRRSLIVPLVADLFTTISIYPHKAITCVQVIQLSPVRLMQPTTYVTVCRESATHTQRPISHI